MTVTNTDNKDIYVGDDIQLVFAYTFRVLNDTDMIVTITDTSVTPNTSQTLTLTQDYTIDNVGNPSGGDVTLIVGGGSVLTDPPSATDNITLLREVPLTQNLDLITNDNFPSQSQEDAFDKGTFIDQQLQEQLGRAVLLAVDITGVDLTLPTPEAGAPIGWNSAADGLTNNPDNTNLSQIDTAAIPDFIGATGGDGVLRVGTSLSYTDGGDFVTIDTAQALTAASSPTFNGLTLTSLTLNLTMNTILDEDDLVSDRDDALATQQSVKAYVDAQIVSQNEFTELIDTPVSYAASSLFFVRVNVGLTALEFVAMTASLVPIVDGGAIITATDVEGALQENRTQIDLNVTAIGLNTTHRTSDGSDHTFIDQSVISGATPTFTGTNFTGLVAANVNIVDAGTIITATEVEGALQENRTAIDLNTLKVTNATHTTDVTGSVALTIDPVAITNKPAATVASGDLVLVSDFDDSGNLKQITAQAIADLGAGGGAIEILDEGGSLTAAVSSIDFVGAGVTASVIGSAVTVTIPGGGGGGATLTEDVNQTTHGFSVNDWVYHNGTIYALADASAAATAESIGIVSAVAGVDDFTIQFGGYITGLTGLTAGEGHFLSETAGEITATAPSTEGAVIKPVLIADGTTSGFIFNMRGVEITGTTSWYQSFSNGDLTAGILTVAHNLGHKYCQVQIWNDSDKMIMPDDITLVDLDSLTVDLSSYGAISGTWQVVVLDIGTTAANSNAGLTQPFVDGDLSTGVLTVTHSLGNLYPVIQVFDNNGDLVQPDDITSVDANTSDIDLTSYGTLTGTWNAVLLSTGSITFATATDLSLAGQVAEDFAIFDGTNWLAKGGTEKINIVTFTRDQTVASGTQGITGLGFIPSAIHFISGENNTTKFSTGHDTLSDRTCWHNRAGSGTLWEKDFTTSSIRVEESGAIFYEGQVTSFDADGFTITWVRTGAPTGTLEVTAMCYR